MWAQFQGILEAQVSHCKKEEALTGLEKLTHLKG